jgi:hypothetical protein
MLNEPMLRTFALAILITAALAAQDLAKRFEVADIQPSKSGAESNADFLPGG